MSVEVYDRLFYGVVGFGLGVALSTFILLRAFKADMEHLLTQQNERGKHESK